MSVRVVSAAQAAGLDAAAIALGTPPRQLMQAAGRAAAALVLDRFAPEAARGVAVFAGPGNNGGDAWVVAGELARRGVSVRVAEVAPARSPESRAERDAARAVLDDVAPTGNEGVVVDGLLGTGSTGAPSGPVGEAVRRIAALRARDARIVALDIPTGIDATTGAAPGDAVCADLTVTFGTMKRGLLVNRAAAGVIVVVDIGLGDAATSYDAAPILVDEDFVRRVVPPIPADAHKGTRKRLVILGGAPGMAGATILAARAAMRSGIGMVKLCVAPESQAAVQAGEPAAMSAAWPATGGSFELLASWANAVLCGPGLGLGAHARAMIERLLGDWAGPVVLDADALTAFAGDAHALGSLLAAKPGRATVITPHAAEFARLAGVDVHDVNASRFEIADALARTLRATVLLKGVPTVVTDGSRRFVSASGTPVLATAGSGDVLGGIVATLLAQAPVASEAAAAAAWVHGRAGEIAAAGRVRGIALDDVIESLKLAWTVSPLRPGPPILAELPRVGELRS